MLLNGVSLSYRAFLINKHEWEKGTIRFEWQPPESVRGSDDKLYGDHLSILLSATGDIRPERSYEPLDGIIVRLEANSGNVRILIPKDGGKDFELIKEFEGGGPLRREWYNVVLVDHGERITVHVDEKLTVNADIPAKFRTGKSGDSSTESPWGPVKRLHNYGELPGAKRLSSADAVSEPKD